MREPAPRKPPAPPGGDDAIGKALDRTLLRRIFQFVWPYRRLMIAAAVLLPVIAGFEVTLPILLKKAIDEHIAVGRLAGLDQIALLYLLALIGQYTATFAHLYCTQLAGLRAMNDLRLRLHQHVLSLAASFFDKTPVGRLMTRLTSDVESVNDMFASGIVSLLGDVVRMLTFLVAIFVIDWRLALFSMGTAPLLFAVAGMFRRVVRDAFREIRARLARLNTYLQESLSGMKIIQAFAQEKRAARQFDEINAAYRHANTRAIRADAALYSIVEAVGSIAIAGLLWHGGRRIAAGTLTFGVMVAFIEYLGKFFAPIRDLSTKYTVMQQAMAAAERIFALLDTDAPDAPRLPASTVPTPAVVAAGSGAPPLIALSHVTFGYRADRPVLSDVSLSIRRGETVAVVGATGAGKSSLIKLLPRLYEVQMGSVRVEGIDVRAIDPALLRRRLVVVSQDVFLFAGTLAENIGLGDPAVTPEQMQLAMRRVGAAGILSARSEGLAARVVERGANFSAGERQLISFARALCRDPEILILDEATASVDPETERAIERGIGELMQGRTSIVIAHRLSTIQRASRIVVVHRGRIAEEGTHAELLAHDGIYAKLYRLQMMHAAAPAPLPADAAQ